MTSLLPTVKNNSNNNNNNDGGRGYFGLPKEIDTSKIERMLYPRSRCFFEVDVIKHKTPLSVLGPYGKRRRRISIEIWTPLRGNSHSLNSNRSTKKPRELISCKETLKEGEKIRFRIIEPTEENRPLWQGGRQRHIGQDDDDDENQQDRIIEWDVDSSYFVNLGTCMDELHVVKKISNADVREEMDSPTGGGNRSSHHHDIFKCDLQFGSKKKKGGISTFTLIFQSEDDLDDFCNTIDDLQFLEKQRLMFGEGRMRLQRDNSSNRSLTDSKSSRSLRSIRKKSAKTSSKKQQQRQQQQPATALGKTSDLITSAACHYDVYIAPTIPVVKGVPLLGSAVRSVFHLTKRRIRFEVWTPRDLMPLDQLAYGTCTKPLTVSSTIVSSPNQKKSSWFDFKNGLDDEKSGNNEIIVTTKMVDSPTSTNGNEAFHLHDRDKVRVRFLKYNSHNDDGDDDDDGDFSEISDSHNEYDWIERVCKPLDSISVRKYYEKLKVIELEVGKGLEKKIHIITFKSRTDTRSCYNLLMYFKNLEIQRGEKMLQDFLLKDEQYKQQRQLQKEEGETSNGNTKPSSIKLKTKYSEQYEAADTPAVNHGKRNVFSMMKGEEINNQGYNDTAENRNITLLVEIVSALNLPRPSVLNPADPFVVARLGRNDLHQTDYLSDTCNPIWTVKTGSLFLIRTTAREFFTETTSGVTFVVYDYNTARSAEALGRCRVTLNQLLSGNGERIEHNLILTHKYKRREQQQLQQKTVVASQQNDDDSSSRSTLVLRYREASQADVNFMDYLARYEKAYNKKRSDVDLRKSAENILAQPKHPWEESFVPPKAMTPTRYKLKRQRRRDKNDPERIEIRVKPGPDPSRMAQTKWMTKEEIDLCSRERSKQWIEAGSGKLGKVFFELLSCDNLPDFDIIDGKTDAFATVVYEDIAVNSEVINDTLNPRWPPWSQRAFIFHLSHPSSQLNLGIFDLDKQLLGLSRHQFIGRVTIDITNFNPDTVYTLDYELYKSALVEERESSAGKGKPTPTIKVRIRVEWFSPREVLLASLQFPPPQTFVNLQKKRDFISTYQTCHGTPDVTVFSLSTIWSYISTCEQYKQEIRLYFEEGLKTIMLWRGHYPITFKGKGFKLPVHSIIAFVMAVTLAENVNLLPSYTCYGVAWFLLASMKDQHSHPNPWHRCIYFRDILYMALFNQSVPQQSVEQYENESLINNLDIENNKKAKRLKQRMEREREKMINDVGGDVDLLEAQEQLNNVEETDRKDLATKFRAGFSISNPLEGHLHPYQLMLEEKVDQLHTVKSILLWEECYVAFIITASSLTIGTLLLWVPWSILVHWISRIVAWTCFGPWMKFFDPYVRKLENMTREERKEKLMKQLGEQYEKRMMEAQIKKEDVIKQKAMATLMFGKFAVAPSNVKSARHVDYPLPTSTAVPYEFDLNYRHVVAEMKKGQTLIGNMIPLTEDEVGLPISDRRDYLKRT